MIQSERAKAIDAYIEEHPNCARGKQKIEIKGKIEDLESYDIPIDFLQYNHDNHRFSLEIQDHEDKIKRALDPSDIEDVKKIKELLLQDTIEADKLENDLRALDAQREVAVITHDGVVVNGNRRMATIEKLHEENPAKWESLWVIRLPVDISDKDLWKIEAGLQLSKTKVADYGPVNNLLMLRGGSDAGLSHAEISAAMYGWDEKKIEEDLKRLDIIDSFLLFMKAEKNYGIIKNFYLSEHFINIQKSIEKWKKSGEGNKEIKRRLKIFFAYLRVNVIEPSKAFPHLQIRNIGKILQDPRASSALEVPFIDTSNSKEIPIDKIKTDDLVDSFDAANDIRKNEEDRLKPAKLIDKAIHAMESIDKNNLQSSPSTASISDKLEKLSNLVTEMMSHIEK